MKLFKSIILGGLVLAAISLTSCKGWLDINTDPENPSSESATYQTRLAHIEFYTNDANQFAAWRSCMALGDWTRYYNGGTYWNMSIWYPTNSITTTPYQWWFVGAACNIEDMITKAEAAEAWHYAGAGKVIYAYGHMLMTDLYGEMPFTQATGESATPEYDNGKTIYLGCLAALDEGIADLKKSQVSTLPALAEGDWWMNGDVAKWIKFANLLKARWCLKLSKKAAGNYLEGKYDASAILAALHRHRPACLPGKPAGAGGRARLDHHRLHHSGDPRRAAGGAQQAVQAGYVHRCRRFSGEHRRHRFRACAGWLLRRFPGACRSPDGSAGLRHRHSLRYSGGEHHEDAGITAIQPRYFPSCCGREVFYALMQNLYKTLTPMQPALTPFLCRFLYDNVGI